MILQQYLTIGLVLGGKVLADETQHPISDQVIQAPSDDCHNACTELVSVLGEQTTYGSIPDDFKGSFYSARQQEVVPACIIRPLTPQDVSAAVKTISKHNCHFAIKSGGHATFKGASNADGGITIDLKHLNGRELSEDLSTAMIGPANRWGKVYEWLEPMGLAVVGGRLSHVGVGGFMLGGGISFLSRKYGWASDNVRNYELVLSNGSIANINYESHPDLYWALRGGGGNFGIVTRFDLEVYSQGKVWGGNSVYPFSDMKARLGALNIQRPFIFSLRYLGQATSRLANRIVCLLGKCTTSTALFQAFEEVIKKERHDNTYLQTYFSLGYWPRLDVFAGNILTAHSDAEPAAERLAFQDIQNLGTPFHTSTTARNLSDMVKELDPYNPDGYRVVFHEITLRYDAEIISKIYDLWIQEMETIVHLPVAGMFPVIIIQPLSQIATVQREKKGGNPFGFSADDGPIAIFQAWGQWDNKDDDEVVKAAYSRFMANATRMAKEAGIYHPWVYMNYANEEQDVFAGVGKENRQRLKEIQKKYDPEGIFDRLQPGYFKI